ncbi:aminotransferase class V-fold PLP-dependent enzyme [soil metagenome]
MPLYFDNAATSHPKPEEVYQACDLALRFGGNPGRGAHSVSFAAATRQFESRHDIAQFLGIEDSSRLIFTSGCTAAINLVLNGMVGAARLKAGDTVLTSAFEHNAVMRPLKAIADQFGLKLVVVPPLKAHSSSSDNYFSALVDLERLEILLAEHKPALCLLTRASNVTGQILDLPAVAAVIARHCAHSGNLVPLLIDAAQSAGVVTEQLDSAGASSVVSFWVASGHKGLLGPSGIGLLYVREGEVLNPPLRGGTGSRSESFSMPEALPDRLEPGSPAVHLACGVAAGVRYLQSRPGSSGSVRKHETLLSQHFLRGLAKLNSLAKEVSRAQRAHIEVVGRPHWNLDLAEEPQLELLDGYLPTFSLRFVDKDALAITPDIVAQKLDIDFGIATRPGLHCALLAHQTLGTVVQGLLRVSFGYYNSFEEVDLLLAALAEVST